MKPKPLVNPALTTAHAATPTGKDRPDSEGPTDQASKLTLPTGQDSFASAHKSTSGVSASAAVPLAPSLKVGTSMKIDASTQVTAKGRAQTHTIMLGAMAVEEALVFKPVVLAWHKAEPSLGVAPKIYLGSDFLETITPSDADGQTLSALEGALQKSLPQVCIYHAENRPAAVSIKVSDLLREDPSAILLHGLLNINSRQANGFAETESAIWTAAILAAPIFGVHAPSKAAALLGALDKDMLAMCLQENLLFALSFASPAVAQSLLELPGGASADRASDDGMTPLEVAITQGRADMVTLLLQHGADKEQPTSSGETPKELVQDEAFSHMASYLA